MKKIASPTKNKILAPGSSQAARPFPIVGIGASAGGLEASQDLLENISATPGMAFVFIMHLSPQHKSMIAELLGKSTKMPVIEAENNMPLQINHVYVIPPNKDLSVKNGKLMIKKSNEQGYRHMPIDCFFHSLSQHQGNKAIAVILSGTATDGTLGAESIKAEGGITFAQDEKSSKFFGMPQSAINAGCIDFVLSPKEIALELKAIVNHPYLSNARQLQSDEAMISDEKGLDSVFATLRSSMGLDFTYYKSSTLMRRISRRMVLLKIKKLSAYVKVLREEKEEAKKLYEDLLINVTGFFRDPKVFDALKLQVFPQIFKNKKKDQPIRIWVPGCSTGEEAYSLALCFFEMSDNKTAAPQIQIFASDVSEISINKARMGIYGNTIKNHISEERLSRFFVKSGNNYKVSKQLRDACIFSKQNVFNDPPFSNIDLISCRNLLIYFQPVLQKNVFHKFYYALKPDGFLLLGNSEAAGNYSSLFRIVDRKYKIFSKKNLSARQEIEFGPKYFPPLKSGVQDKIISIKAKESDIETLADRIVLADYAPCGVLVDSNMDVIQFRGRTGRYLESAAGKPSLNLFKLAREGLLLDLRAALFEAKKVKHSIKKQEIEIRSGNHRQLININVIPVKPYTLDEEFYLVLFEEVAGVDPEKSPLKGAEKKVLKGISLQNEKYVQAMQKELAETKEYLQSIIEEQERANEEMKSANEEILSGNEELQSANEELETAKEELQSSNEELITLNEELQNRNSEIALVNNDLINLLNSINMPVIMMGTDLVIRRITPQAEKVLNLVSTDIGRSIINIKLNPDIPDLKKILLNVIDSLNPINMEIKTEYDNWYSLFIRPYRTTDNKIDGVIMLFVDITERKKSEALIRKSGEFAQNIVETVRESLVIVDEDIKVTSVNSSFYKLFKVDPKDTLGHTLFDLGNGQWDIPELKRLLEDVLNKDLVFDNFLVSHFFKSIGQKSILLNARRITASNDGKKMVLLALDDVTEEKAVEKKLHASEVRYKSYMELTGQLGWVADERGEVKEDIPSWRKFTGQSIEETRGFGWIKALHPEDADRVMQIWKKAVETKNIYEVEYRIRRFDGIYKPFLVRGIPVFKEKDSVQEWIGTCIDISDLKRVETILKRDKKELADFLQEQTKKLFLANREKERSKRLSDIGTLASTVAHELRNPLTAINMAIYNIKRKVPDLKIESHINTISKKILESNQIIDNLLSYSKIAVSHFKPVDIKNILHECIKETTKRFPSKKIMINEKITPLKNLAIEADPNQLKEVFNNVLNNSFDAINTQTGLIEIEAILQEDHLSIRIKDNGEGIDKENLLKIFNPFFTTKAKGTGLGLSVCHQIMVLHAGSITLESEKNQGTLVTLTLPVGVSKNVEEA